MNRFKMKSRIPAILAALAVCVSCVEIESGFGSAYTPAEQNYEMFIAEIPIEEMEMCMADSLSGFSQDIVSVGSIRDAEGKVTRRNCALTIIPVTRKMNFGKNPKFKSFHMGLALDTVSVEDSRQRFAMQNLQIYELSKAIALDKDFANSKIEHGAKSVIKRNPVFSGSDSLSVDFTEEFGKKFFELTESDYTNWASYTKKIPGLYLTSSDPMGTGGRFNNFELQLVYNIDEGYLAGNYAKLNFSAEYDGVQKDSSFLFVFGAQTFFDGDSLILNTFNSSFPQYALNLTDEEATRSREGKATDKVFIGGGAGIKPVIRASYLRDIVSKEIESKGGDPSKAIINKASVFIPFEFPEDYTKMGIYPAALSPTTRISGKDNVTYMSITDTSSSSENSGDVDRNNLWYSPDFSYHMQRLLQLKEDDSDYKKGSYDLWFMTMKFGTTTTDNSDTDLASYYEMLAYQAYYGSMYGGYGGNNATTSYSNYISYMMMASMLSNNTETSTTVELDRESYYCAYVNGPEYPDAKKRPKLRIIYSLPKIR